MMRAQAEVKGLKAQLPSDEEAKEKSPLQSQIKELEGVRLLLSHISEWN